MEAWVTWRERWFLKPAIERECCGKRRSFNDAVEGTDGDWQYIKALDMA
jgi:hypothetical protein